MNERIGVGFKSVPTVERLLARSAKLAPASHPCVLHPLEPDITRITGEAFDNRVQAVGVLRAVDAAPRQQAGEMRDAYPEHLLGEDMIDALLKVRNFGRQGLGEAACDLSQEYPRLRTRVKESNRAVRPKVRSAIVCRPGVGQSIEYPVGKSGGVNTSSLERFAMQVRTSGLRPRSVKLACSFIWPLPSHSPTVSQQALA